MYAGQTGQLVKVHNIEHIVLYQKCKMKFAMPIYGFMVSSFKGTTKKHINITVVYMYSTSNFHAIYGFTKYKHVILTPW